MWRKIACTLLILFVITAINSSAQNGTIKGIVIDDATGESLPGVNVIIEGTQTGSVTDLDGHFNISIIPGKYVLKISFISYATLIIKEVDVKEGGVTNLGTVRLKEAVNELTQVNVTAEMLRNNENAILTMKQKSANVIDGISADGIKKTGDSDAGSTMKRVPGISVSNGKYVFVRGLGDRYTKTTLNGMDIPGLDPDRNTLQMDIFPVNIIDNIIVHKSFVAELPADFTGGVIDISLKEFPEVKTGSFSLSASYNPNFHFNKNYLDYTGGKTDFLGFDDGTRAIPAVSNIPFYTDALSDPEGPEGSRYKEILGSFNPEMAAFRSRSTMDYNIGFDFGNQKVKKKATLGYNFVLSYRNETEYYNNALYANYGVSGDPGIYEMDVREIQTGEFGVNNILISGLAGFAVKTKNSKVKINFLHLQNGESKAGIFDFKSTDLGAVFEGYQHNLEYSQREISNVLLTGKHLLKDNKWQAEWKISPTLSQISDPDIRFTRYEIRDGEYHIGTEAGFPQRIWRDLSEVNMNSQLNLVREFKFRGENAKIKTGGAYVYKKREYVLRSFNLNIRNLELTGDPNELFATENLWPAEGNITSGTTYEATFLPVNPNQYDANISNIAGYAAGEINPLKQLKTIIGVRVEKYVQRYTGQDQLGYNDLNNEKVLDNLNILPSVNMVWSLSEKTNLRGSFTQTLARPTFKELSYAEIYDPITGRTFIGGLFRDENTQTGTVYWDGELKSTDINNYDLRWEYFPASGQTISMGVFYKQLKNPIEIVQYATQVGAFQPRNVGDGEILGGEIEVRHNFELTGKSFNFIFNFTWIQSRITLSETEYESRVENARSGQEVKKYRDMAGQAPYLINGGLMYSGRKKKFWKTFDAGIYYNVQGKTLQYVGIANRPDIYVNPFHSLNFNANKKFGKNDKWNCGMKIDNLLNDKTESVFSSFMAADQYFTRLEPGRKFTLRISYRIAGR